MKKVAFTIYFFAFTFSLFAEDGLPEGSDAKLHSATSENTITKHAAVNEIVINYAMIEKFNNAEYSDNLLSFTDLVQGYNFEEICQINQAYRSGEIEVLSETSIHEFAKKNLNNDNWLHLYSESELKAKE
jgi:hypothetical protein